VIPILTGSFEIGYDDDRPNTPPRYVLVLQTAGRTTVLPVPTRALAQLMAVRSRAGRPRTGGSKATKGRRR
jgi:hypothetical protein